MAAILIGIGLLLVVVSGSFVIVQPTEMAGKRRLGQVAVTQPLGPGLHFKLPLLDSIDKIQVSLETYRIDHSRLPSPSGSATGSRPARC